MFLDPSKGKNARYGDYSAWISLAVAPGGILYVDADLDRRPTPRIVAEGLELARGFQPHGIGIEANVFQELLADEFVRQAMALGVSWPVFPIENMIDKTIRIRRIGPYLFRKHLRFKGGSKGAKLLVQQLKDFPCGQHDDGPDALEGAIGLALQLASGTTERIGGRVGG